MSVIAYAAVLGLSYCCAVVVYRIWLSPLAHIPGPRLACATYWFEFYYDVILRGQYTFKIKILHEKYGPIIRVNPHEVHIHDPTFFNEIYAGPSKKDRWSWASKALTLEHDIFTAAAYDDHKRKRAPLNHFFSKTRVRNFQKNIEEPIHKVLAKFEDYKVNGKPLPLDAAMFALSNDNIMQYAFGKSYDRIAVDGFDPSFRRDAVIATNNAHIMKHMPFIIWILRMIPEKLLRKSVPGMAGWFQLQEDIQGQVVQTQRENVQMPRGQLQDTLFGELLEDKSSNLIQSFHYLWQNGLIIVIAGSTTTATTMFTTVFHLLRNTRSLARLRHELASEFGDADLSAMPDLNQIEKPPYITAVIQEGLRMSGTVTTRLQRIDRVAPMIYNNTQNAQSYNIPPGTPVASTVLLIHYDPMYYPDPYEFKPERWLKDNQDKTSATKFFFPFLKGSRQCIGLNFAYAEIYLLLFHMFKPGAYGCHGAKRIGDRGCLQLFETTYKDIEVIGDGLGPIYRSDSRGVRILITPAADQTCT